MNDTLYFILFAVGAFALFVAEVFIPGGIIGAVGVLSLFAACGFAVAAFGWATVAQRNTVIASRGRFC